jgi:hypothetical protein
MLWLDGALPTLMRLSKPLALRPLNLTGEPNRGSGVDLPRIIATIVASFLIAFKERSSKLTIPYVALRCINYFRKRVKYRMNQIFGSIIWISFVYRLYF